MTPDADSPLRSLVQARPWLRWCGQVRDRHSLHLQAHMLWDAGSARAPNTPPRRHVSFDIWCRDNPNRVCDLWLSGALVHEYVFDPALPLASDAALMVHARGAFVQQHGASAQGWELAAWCFHGQQGVTAVHGVSLTQHSLSAREHGVRLHLVRPLWVKALVTVRQRMPLLRSTPQAWLIVVEGLFATALRLHRGTPADIQPACLSGNNDDALAQLTSHLTALTPGGQQQPPVFVVGYGLHAGDNAVMQAFGAQSELTLTRGMRARTRASRPAASTLNSKSPTPGTT